MLNRNIFNFFLSSCLLCFSCSPKKKSANFSSITDVFDDSVKILPPAINNFNGNGVEAVIPGNASHVEIDFNGKMIKSCGNIIIPDTVAQCPPEEESCQVSVTACDERTKECSQPSTMTVVIKEDGESSSDSAAAIAAFEAEQGKLVLARQLKNDACSAAGELKALQDSLSDEGVGLQAGIQKICDTPECDIVLSFDQFKEDFENLLAEKALLNFLSDGEDSEDDEDNEDDEDDEDDVAMLAIGGTLAAAGVGVATGVGVAESRKAKRAKEEALANDEELKNLTEMQGNLKEANKTLEAKVKAGEVDKTSVDKLQVALAAQAEEVKSLKRQRKYLVADRAAVKAEFENLKKQGLGDQLAETTAALDELGEQMQAQKLEKDRLEQQVKGQQAELEQQARDGGIKDQELITAKQTADKALEDNTELQLKQIELEGQLRNLKALQAQNLQLEGVEAQALARQKQGAELARAAEAEQVRLQGLLDKAEARLGVRRGEDASKEIARLNGLLAEQGKRLTASKGLVTKSKEVIKKLGGDKKKLKGELAAKEAKVVGLQGDLETKGALITQLRAESGRLRGELDGLETKGIASAADLEKLQAEKATLETQVQELGKSEAGNARTAAELQKVKAELVAKTKAFGAKQIELENVQEQLSQKTQDLVDLQYNSNQDIERLSDENTRLTDELAALKENPAVSAAELEVKAQELAAVQGELETQKKAMKLLEADLTKSAAQYQLSFNFQRALIGAQSAKKKDLKKALDEQVALVKTLKEQGKINNVKIDDLTADLDTATASLKKQTADLKTAVNQIKTLKSGRNLAKTLKTGFESWSPGFKRRISFLLNSGSYQEVISLLHSAHLKIASMAGNNRTLSRASGGVGEVYNESAQRGQTIQNMKAELERVIKGMEAKIASSKGKVGYLNKIKKDLVQIKGFSLTAQEDSSAFSEVLNKFLLNSIVTIQSKAFVLNSDLDEIMLENF